MKISDRIVCISFGEKIAEGTPSKTQTNPRVIKAYLGSEDAAIGILDMTQTATKLEPARKMLSFDTVEPYYDHVYALKGDSIELMEGETVALIGANGAGKSSILRAITRLRKIKSGSISYLGDRIDGRPAAKTVRRGIAMAPEGRHCAKACPGHRLRHRVDQSG